MFTILAVLGFGIAVILILFAFGMKKLQNVNDERVCICALNADEDDKYKKSKILTLCKQFNEILVDFRGRRNEFWNCFGQFIVIIAIITLLVLLMILDKIKPDAALPIISALGGLGIGKTIANTKNNTVYENQPDETKKEDNEK